MPGQPGQGQCPFCQLISNPQQLMTVGETDNFYAWLEVNPRARGHTMVVPKEHVENILELSMDEWQEAFKLTREVVEKAKKGLDADGASITVNIEETGGQMLPHAYIQIFPRFEEDENAGTPTGAIFPQQEELQNQLEGIQSSMSSVSVDLGGESHEAHPESQNFKDESKIDRIINQTDVGGNGEPESTTVEQSENSPEESDEAGTNAERKRKKENLRGENPGTEGTDSTPQSGEPEEKQPQQGEVKEDSGSSTPPNLEALIEHYGGPEEFLQSREMQALLGRTDYSLREKKATYDGESFEWR